MQKSQKKEQLNLLTTVSAGDCLYICLLVSLCFLLFLLKKSNPPPPPFSPLAREEERKENNYYERGKKISAIKKYSP